MEGEESLQTDKGAKLLVGINEQYWHWYQFLGTKFTCGYQIINFPFFKI